MVPVEMTDKLQAAPVVAEAALEPEEDELEEDPDEPELSLDPPSDEDPPELPVGLLLVEL